MKKVLIIPLMTMLLCYSVFGQLTPQQAIAQMKRGINIGNSLDATPNETSWGNPPIQKYYFDDFVSAGFTCVRIPITWRYHVSKNSPYTINQTFLNRVDTLVSWGLNKGLFIIINMHHESGLKGTDTMKNLAAKADTLAKYDSIWSQVSRHFKNKSDHLLFEMLNEPQVMTPASVDSFNKRALAIIRKSNPTRVVIFSGNAYTGSAQLIAAKIPDPADKHLIGYYHSYDPWNFAGLAIGTYGSSSDISSSNAIFNQVASWSGSNQVPVTLDECGAVLQCDYNSRMLYYATIVEQVLNHGIAFNVWDDNGDFQTYIRNNRKWNDAKDVIIHTYKESPTQLKAVVVDTTVTLSWLNRTTLNDSIYVDRRTAATVFTPVALLGPGASQFYDSVLNKNTVYYYRLRTNLLDSIDLYSYPISATVVGVRMSYQGYPAQIPGTIQAENFDKGGEGQTYHDINSANMGGAYRLTEGVDVEARPDSGYQIGYVASGEWTQYSVHVNLPGYFRIDAYTASINGGGKYNFTFGKIATSSKTVPKTGDSTTLAISSTYRVLLDTGNQIMTFKIVAGAIPFTIDRFVFVQDSSKTGINIGKKTNGFTIFPNPAGSYITIQKPESINTAKLDVFNILGVKLLSKVINNKETAFPVDKMAKGVYIFLFTSNTSTETIKIIIQK